MHIDEGYFTESELLPVMQLGLGDTGSSHEIVTYIVGPLRCYQGRVLFCYFYVISLVPHRKQFQMVHWDCYRLLVPIDMSSTQRLIIIVTISMHHHIQIK